MDERYPLHIYYHGTEDLQHLFENLCLIALERGETPFAYCSVGKESLKNFLINVLGCFQSFRNREIFAKLDLPILDSEKSYKILQSFGF